MSNRSPAHLAVRSARPADAAAIVGVIRSGFEQRILDLTIYGAAGVIDWVATHLCLPHDAAERLYMLANEGPTAIGCVELTPRGDHLFLSYVCVLPSHRRTGVGSVLLAAAVRDVRSRTQSTLRLDVFDGNSAGMAWYQGLGFQQTGTAYLCDASDTLPEPKIAARVSGLPVANAAHEAFGFSEFQVETESGATSVGRLGDRWWRLATQSGTGMEVLDDHDLLSTLRELDPHRGLLIQLDSVTPQASVVQLLKIHRMEIEIDRLLEQL